MPETEQKVLAVVDKAMPIINDMVVGFVGVYTANLDALGEKREAELARHRTAALLNTLMNPVVQLMCVQQVERLHKALKGK